MLIDIVWAQVMQWQNEAISFVPLILNSVSSSMQRSAHFNKLVALADSKLSGSSGGNQSLFHPTVG